MLFDLTPLPAGPVALEQALEALTDDQLVALARNVRLVIDPSKRISPRQQMARALAVRTGLGRAEAWTASERALVAQLVLARGRLFCDELEHAQRLGEQGWIFSVRDEERTQLVMPLAFQLTLPWIERESPRSARVLLAQTSDANVNLLARHFQPRAIGLPRALALEPVLGALVDPGSVRGLMGELGPAETQVLRGVVSRGGEVDTEELLDIERQPLRLQTTTGATRARSGVSFELERRGLLLPLPPNRHCLPSEVLGVVAERQLQRLNARRSASLAALADRDEQPSRAQYSLDVAPLAVAISLVARHKRPARRSVGTPKSLIKSLAKQFGADVAAVELVAALCRKIGLWEPIDVVPSMSFGQLGRALFETWKDGAVWDEGRLVAEIQRAGKGTRQPSPGSVVRDVVIEALRAVATDAWVPYALLQQYVFGDVRLLGLDSQQTRFARRTSLEVVAVAEIFDRVLFQSLFALGALDVAEAEPDAEQPGPLVRLNRRGLSFVSDEPTEVVSRAHFVDDHTIAVGSADSLAALLALSDLVEVGDLTGGLNLLLSSHLVEAKLSAGADPHELEQRISAVCPPSSQLADILFHAGERLQPVQFVPCSGFVWLDDPRLLQEVRSKRALAALFVEPSPPGGLLVAADVPWDRLVRRCRAAGIDVRRDEQGTARASASARSASKRTPVVSPGRRISQSS